MFALDQIISLLKFDSLYKKLNKINDLKERVRIALKAIEKILPFDIEYHQKNFKDSNALRTEADIFFVKHKGNTEALFVVLKMYTKSIAKAENSSAELALTYANRSVILYHLDKLEECIRDIDRALQLNYPNHLKANLLRRKAKCLKMLKKLDFDRVCEEAREWLGSMTVSDEKKEKMESKIIYVNKKLNHKYQLEENKSLQKIALPEIIPNERIPSASESISIKYTSNFGKHFVANRDIDVGEILIIEKAYAAILSQENIYTHCAHCFIRLWDSVPCESCIYAMYCSEKCKFEAWHRYHDIECAVAAHLIALQMNELALLGLKLVILAVRESGGIRKLKMQLKKVDDSEDFLLKSFCEDEIYYSDKYRPFYNLVTHAQDRKQYDLLAISLNAAITLYYVFTLTSFLGYSRSKDISTLHENEDAIYLGKLIAKHYMLAQLNYYQFNEIFKGKFVVIGSAIGSVTSLLNHSCNPNVNRCSRLEDNSLQQIVYTINPIKEGSQIFDNYGCTFAFLSKSDRAVQLQRYYFKCNCIACHNNWPLFKDVPSILSIMATKESKIEVARAIIRGQVHHNAITEFCIHKYPGDKMNILSNLARSIRIVHEHTLKPTREYIELIELFCQAFALLFGNFFQL